MSDVELNGLQRQLASEVVPAGLGWGGGRQHGGSSVEYSLPADLERTCLFWGPKSLIHGCTKLLFFFFSLCPFLPFQFFNSIQKQVTDQKFYCKHQTIRQGRGSLGLCWWLQFFKTETSVGRGRRMELKTFFFLILRGWVWTLFLEVNGCDLPLFFASDLLKKIQRTSCVRLALP